MFWKKKKMIFSFMLSFVLLFSFCSVSSASDYVHIDTPMQKPQLSDTVLAYVVIHYDSGQYPDIMGVVVRPQYVDSVPETSGKIGQYTVYANLTNTTQYVFVGTSTNVNGINDALEARVTWYYLSTGQRFWTETLTDANDWTSGTDSFSYRTSSYYDFNMISEGFSSGTTSLGTSFVVDWADGQQTDYASEVEKGTGDALKDSEEREKQNAETTGNSSVNDSTSAISDETETLKSGMQSFISGISTEATDCSWTFPSIKLPATSVTPAVTLSQEHVIDFQTYFDMIPNNIMLIVQYSLLLGLSLYACKEFYQLVFSLLTGEFVDFLYRKG